jgi:WD40 repeat protein
VWDATDGQCLLTLRGHQAWVRSCVWSPNGARLASASDDKAVKVWDAAGGECLLTLRGHEGPVCSCAWSADGSRLASGSFDKTVRVWDAAGGACLLTLRGRQGGVYSCAWSPDGTRLASGSTDGTVKAWDAASGQCLWTGHLFPDLQVATIDGETGRVRHASPEAWRFLGWRWFDPDLGRHRLLPAEVFGPLPS